MATKPLILLVAGLFLLPIAMALSIQEANFEYVIVGNSVQAVQSYHFPEPTSASFFIPLPRVFEQLKITQDEQPVSYQEAQGILYFDTDQANGVKISYLSQSYLDGDNFVSSVSVPLIAEHLEIMLTLPPKAVLRGEEQDPSVGAVYPKAAKILSNGESITLQWQREQFSNTDELALYVRYRQNKESFLMIVIFLVGIPGLAVLLVLLRALRKRSKITLSEQQAELPQTERKSAPSDVTKHLKEDEEQIVTILKQREDSCEQGTLRVITGFSKAKLSVLLQELEERKIIHKEKRGKKNLVFLKEL